MKPKAHQIKFAKGYKDKVLCCHEGGTGKSACACLWLADGRDSDALVICPKRVVEKWREELRAWKTKATVLSKEQFKKHPIRKWSAVVVDEADEFASPLFTKGRSQLSTALYNLLKLHDVPVFLCTGTPIRSNPWNLHSLLCFIGVYIPWKAWRSKFFVLERPAFMNRFAYFPKPDWRIKIRPFLEKYADIVLMKDCVDELPAIEEKTLSTPCEPFKKGLIIEPKALFVAKHRWEQREKFDAILEIAREYRKVLVVAYYVEQIEELNRQLKKERMTYMVHGQVKGQEALLKAANEDDECFLIVQASLGVGFDADSFSCVIFASMSYAVRDFVQMKWRVRRIKNLHPVIYHYLLGGSCDKAVLSNIQKGKDFIPSEYRLYEDA